LKVFIFLPVKIYFTRSSYQSIKLMIDRQFN
jgi:hypothetical protein